MSYKGLFFFEEFGGGIWNFGVSISIEISNILTKLFGETNDKFV